MSTEITEVQTAVAEFDKVAAGIAALKEKYGSVVYDVSVSKDMEAAKEARAAIREPRYEIERVRKDAKAPILKLGKELDSRAKQITDELLAIEEPISEQIKHEESRKEREKQAKIDAELKRVTDLQERVAYLRGSPNISSLSPPELIAEHFSDLESEVVDASMQEYEQQALEAKAAGLGRLRDMHAAAVARVAEQARIAAEREELNRLRAESAERDRKEKEARDAEHAKQQEELAAERQRIADEERASKKERDRQQAIHDAQLKAQRDQEEKERRERQAVIDAENARIAEANRIEAKRLADAQAVIDKREAEEKIQREAQEAADAERARIGAITEPTRDEIISVVAKHWNVPVEIVAKWKPFKGGSSRQAAA